MDSNTFINIVAIVLSSSAVGGIVKWLVSIELRHLHVETQTKLEQIKTDLNYAAFQKQTTFAKLHEKRAEVIADLYSKLVAVHVAMHVLVSPQEWEPGPDRQKQREKDASDAAVAFTRYFNAHQIYFEETLCDLINKLNNELFKVYSLILQNPKSGKDAWVHLEKEVPPIRKEIEGTFRKLLGLTPPGTTLPKVD